MGGGPAPPPHPTPSSEPGKLHSDYKMHPHLPPKFGGGSASYSPRNMVINSVVPFNLVEKQ